MEKNLFFFNGCFDKSRIKFLISWSLKNCGDQITLDLLENLKEMGFLYATKAGVSLGVDDLQIPLTKAQLLQDSMVTMQMAHVNSKKGFVSGIEKFQQLIDTWNRTSETLKQNVINYFKITDILNPVYMMAFSGARGNISQVRQLVGMRGLMSDPQGEILDFPIKSNFREGLTLTEYIISCYGARKGLVDTALRTANAGYLTRRLVDVSHQLVINEFDCKTKLGIKINNIIENNKIIVPLQNRLVGRVLAEYIYDKPLFLAKQVDNNLHFGSEKPLGSITEKTKNFFAKQPSKSISQQKSIEFFSLVSYLVCVYFAPNFSNSIWKPWRYYYDTKSKIKLKKNAKIQKFDINFNINQKFVFFQLVLFIQNLYYSNTQLIAFPNKEISLSLATKIAFLKKEVLVRSPLTCEIQNSICQLCYGWSLTSDKLIALGEAVGIIAAQSIGEPGTQLTMRTFHTGGVFSGDMINQIKAPSNGIVQFPEFLHGMLIRTPHGKIAFLTKVSGQFNFYFTQNPNLSEKLSTSNTNLNEKINEISKNETVNPNKTIFDKLQLEKLIKKTFEIPSLTILFARNNQIVTKTQIIAEFSFLLNTQEEHVYANYNLNAEVEGEIFFKKVFVHTKTTENIIRSKKTAKLGSIWILSGQIHKQPIPVALFPQYGDIVDKQSILGQYQSMFPYNNNGFLKILSQNVQNKKSDALLNNLQLSCKYKNKINNANQLVVQKEKNTKIFVQHSILSFPIHCIQYKKIGYFIPFWNHTKSRFNKASCESFLNNFFLINSLQQEFYNVKKFQKTFYFKSFPKKYHSQTGGVVFSDTFYSNSTFSQGESFWLSEENYIFHKKNIIFFNLNNSKNKYFDKLVFQNLKPIAKKFPLIWIKKKYIINTKKYRKWLNTTNPLILNSNNQGKISSFYSKLSGCVEITSFYKNFSSILKKKNNNNLFFKRKILNKKLYKFKLMSLLKFPTPYCSVCKPVFLQHTYVHIGFRINPIYFINFSLKKNLLHNTDAMQINKRVKLTKLHIEQKIFSNYTEQIKKINSYIYHGNKKNKKKTSFSISPLKKNKLPCLHPQFPWSKNRKTSIDFKLQSFSYHFYKPFFSKKKIVRSFTTKKKLYSKFPTTFKFQDSLYPVIPIFWSINNFQLQNIVLVEKKQIKTAILNKLSNITLTNELIINQPDTNLKIIIAQQMQTKCLLRYLCLNGNFCYLALLY